LSKVISSIPWVSKVERKIWEKEAKKCSRSRFNLFGEPVLQSKRQFWKLDKQIEETWAQKEGSIGELIVSQKLSCHLCW
jgi:hypothetical protein